MLSIGRSSTNMVALLGSQNRPLLINYPNGCRRVESARRGKFRSYRAGLGIQRKKRDKFGLNELAVLPAAEVTVLSSRPALRCAAPWRRTPTGRQTMSSKKKTTPAASPADLPALRIGSRVRCTDDGVL